VSPRRQDDSLIIELAKDFEHLPWWAGLVTAALVLGVSFVLPHLPVRGALGPLIVVFGQVFLWLLAFAIVLATLTGVIRRAFDRRRFDRTADLGELNPLQFEGYLREYYRRAGYVVTPRGGPGADGGVDLIIEKPGQRVIVQCKHWKTWKVGVPKVRELWGLVDHEKASGAVLVASGTFTPEARAFAVGKRLELVDGEALARMVAQVRGVSVTRACPSCGSEMVLRTAGRGVHQGEQFWGCSRFPACRGRAPA